MHMAEHSNGDNRAAARLNLLSPLSFFFDKPEDRDDVWRINNVFVPLLAVAIIAAGWVGWRADAVGPVLLWVFASLAAGGTAGFLFGIPKSGIPLKSDAAPAAGAAQHGASESAGAATVRSRPNTNLEEVSDWLTKILVGLTLVNLNELQVTVRNISANAAAAIRPQPTAADISAATAIVVGFALIGFLAVYLYMRLFVQGAIARSDNTLFDNAVARARKIGRDEAPRVGKISRADVPLHMRPVVANGSGDTGNAGENQADNQREKQDDIEALAIPSEPEVPSAETIAAAQEVANAAPPDRPEIVLQPLRKLASRYEALRQEKEYSPNRTRSMTDIVQKMRPYAIAAAPYIREMIDSASTGDHLAATVILQMKFMQEHMEWLARRLVEERAFIGYQAASALLARVRLAGVPESQAIKAAVARAKADRAALGINESSLDQLIDQILAAR